MDIQEYLVAWGTYLSACSLMIMIGWSLTRRWWSPLRDIVRLVVVALMLTPVAHENDPALMVPASTVAVLGWITGEDAAMANAMIVLLTSSALAVLLAVAHHVYRSRRPGAAAKPKVAKTEPTVSGSDTDSGPAGNCTENKQSVA